MSSGDYNAWKTYWANLEITTSDLQQLANYLFEKEEPLSVDGLVHVLINQRLAEREAERKSKLETAGKIYLPGNSYEVGTKVSFPEFDRKQANVISNRPGENVAIGTFTVTEVEFEDGTRSSFATNLPDHALNTKVYKSKDDDVEDPVEIHNKFAPALRTKAPQSTRKSIRTCPHRGHLVPPVFTDRCWQGISQSC